MNERRCVVRLHSYDEDQGRIEDMKLEFETEELAGEVPVVGDRIVDPGVPGGLDRNQPANRRIFEVIDRYFLPGAHGHDMSYVALVVKSVPGTDREYAIVCVS